MHVILKSGAVAKLYTRTELKPDVKALAAAEKAVGGYVRLTSSERDAMLAMLPLLNFLNGLEREFQPLVSRANLGLKRLRTVITLLNNLTTDIFSSNIPIEQKISLRHDAQSIHWRVGSYPEGPSKDKYGIWFSENEVETILNATRDHCLTCLADSQQQRRCKLRKALSKVPLTCGKDDNGEDGFCPYIGGV